MGNENKVVILDADGLIGLINTEDANHKKAVTISAMLTKQSTTVLTPVTVIIEAITALKRRINRPDLAKNLVNMYTDKKIAIIDVTADILPLAITYFNPHDSKQNTFFDAVIAAFAKQQNAQAIFSFDKWYQKQGFTLAGDLIAVKH